MFCKTGLNFFCRSSRFPSSVGSLGIFRDALPFALAAIRRLLWLGQRSHFISLASRDAFGEVEDAIFEEGFPDSSGLARGESCFLCV